MRIHLLSFWKLQQTDDDDRSVLRNGSKYVW